MKTYEGYILVAELTKKANKSACWLYEIKGVQIEYIGGIPVIKSDSIPEKYNHLVQECQDLKNYYPYAELSRELGRVKDFIGVIQCNRKKKNLPELENIKIGGYRFLKISDEFIEQVKKGLTPFKLNPKCDINDYKVIIEMQDMKIGFY